MGLDSKSGFGQKCSVHFDDLQYDQIWQNFATLAKSFGNFLILNIVFDKILNPMWPIFHAVRQIFVAINGQIWKINLAIWSH